MSLYAKNIKKYKEISQNRVRRSPIMKIPIHELDRDNEDRCIESKITTFKSSFKIHDREVVDSGSLNPFYLPPREKLFGGKDFKRKVKKEPFIMSEPHTICDIDKTFYKIIEGRPIRQFVDVKVYMRDIRNIALTKSNIAYLRDQILQIDNSYNYEVEEYEKINDLFTKTRNNFVAFAKECYTTAQKIHEKAEKKAKELQTAIERLEAYGFQFVKIRNEVGHLGATYDVLNIYCRFLNSLAPLPWRELYDEEFKRSSCGIAENDSLSDESIEMYIKRYNLKNPRPQLYFKRPDSMTQVFERLSAQCLNYMQIDVFSSHISSSVVKSRDYLKSLALEEMEQFQYCVNMYEKELEWIKEQEVIHKDLFENLIITKFYELYASYDTSKLFTCVQYVNMRIFGNPEDPKDSVSFLAQQLEDLYIELTSDMDNLNQEVVKAATTEFFAEDIRTMKMAALAQRQLRECDILSNALFTSFEPPRYMKKIKKQDKTTRKSNTKL